MPVTDITTKVSSFMQRLIKEEYQFDLVCDNQNIVSSEGKVVDVFKKLVFELEEFESLLPHRAGNTSSFSCHQSLMNNLRPVMPKKEIFMISK